ncbi:MAG: hypothetical protein HYX31_00385 [Mycobacterium sp.]|nr:hypothetical protein [Mycobacterium sp.]
MTVEEGDEVWVYFQGPHRFDNGVCAKGIVEDIDPGMSEVTRRSLHTPPRLRDGLVDQSVPAE